MPPELAELRRWLAKVDHDIRTAEAALALSQPVTDTAAFHCQQAVEKLLKSFLVSREHDFEKIHDLRVLVVDCGKYDPGFCTLADKVGPLTAYAVRYRYPGPCDPTVDEVKRALAVVLEVRTFVQQRLPDGLGDK